MTSPFLYFPHERLSPAELTAACLDGHLVGLGEGYLPADAIETASMRAASLRSILGDRLAASLVSAAWIYGALLTPPHRHTASRAVARRVTKVVSRRVILHDLRLSAEDLVEIGGIFVTSPRRTLIDLARRSDSADAASAAQGMVAVAPHLGSQALAWVRARRRLPAAHRAERFLAGLVDDSVSQM